MKIDLIRDICRWHGKQEGRGRYRMPDKTIVELHRAGVDISYNGVDYMHYHPADIFGAYGVLFAWIEPHVCVPILYYPYYCD